MIREITFNTKNKEIKEEMIDEVCKNDPFVPNKSPLEQKVDNIEKELNITQNAVDYLILSNRPDARILNAIINDNLVDYLVMRINKKVLNYNEIVDIYPELKEQIDELLLNK